MTIAWRFFALLILIVGDSRSAGSDVTESSTVTVSQSKVPSEDFKEDNENMTVRKLMKAYEACTSGLRKTQATRRTMSLKQVAPANFSKEAMERNKSGCFLGYSQWDVVLIAAASFMFMFFIYLFPTRSRQASKLKI